MNETRQEQEVDVLIFGAGAAGMTAALTAKRAGLSVLLCEKTAQVGGITATSGGTTWIPGTHLSVKAGVPDSVDAARTFLQHVCRGLAGEDLREAFLQSGAKMIAELDAETEVKFVAAQAHPDYIGNVQGEAFGGRALAPLPFDGKLLGKDFERVRPPRSEFLALGGMMVNRNELPALLNPFASLANLKTALGVVLPYFKDRLRFARGTRLVMGNALVGRLYYSLLQNQVPVRFNCEIVQLLTADGKVIGAKVRENGEEYDIVARKGVVLATGGVGHHRELRERYFPKNALPSYAPDTHTADGIVAAQNIGATLANTENPALWFPTSCKKTTNGTAMWPHIILDRAKPGLLAVLPNGKRFVNESDSYHDFSTAQIRASSADGIATAFLLVDHAFIEQYGIGFILPGGKSLNAHLQQNYLSRADTWQELAEKVGIHSETLLHTIARYNQLAASGKDSDFARGSTPMNRFNGDASVQPNPCLRPLADKGPYYALAVRPADLASSMGLACNVYGQVLDEQNRVIDGLYACGNDLASIFQGTYPGPGTTIGPAMTFGWRIAKYLAGQLD